MTSPDRTPTGEPPQYTTLLTSLHLLDDDKRSVHDSDTNCTISRDHNGDLQLTAENMGRSYTTTYKELLQGPCRGLKAKTLALSIREVMARRLRGESDFPLTDTLTNPTAKGEAFDLSEDTFEEDPTDRSTEVVDDDDVVEVEDAYDADEAGFAVTSE